MTYFPSYFYLSCFSRELELTVCIHLFEGIVTGKSNISGAGQHARNLGKNLSQITFSPQNLFLLLGPFTD
jgi:hypothetical protein